MKPEPLLIVNCSCFMKKHRKTYLATLQDPNLEATQFGQKNSAVRFAKQLDQSFCNLKLVGLSLGRMSRERKLKGRRFESTHRCLNRKIDPLKPQNFQTIQMAQL